MGHNVVHARQEELDIMLGGDRGIQQAAQLMAVYMRTRVVTCPGRGLPGKAAQPLSGEQPRLYKAQHQE